jgi:hypothetical protein
MAPRVRHSKVVTIPDDPNYPVGSNEWNDDHVIEGLENVDNTSDANKPVSTAQAAADTAVASAAASALAAGLALKAPVANPVFTGVVKVGDTGGSTDKLAVVNQTTNTETSLGFYQSGVAQWSWGMTAGSGVMRLRQNGITAGQDAFTVDLNGNGVFTGFLTADAFNATGASNQFGSAFCARGAGVEIEFGHSNTAGYGSVLANDFTAGNPFLLFNGQVGTAGNTYKTVGIKGSIIKSDLGGGFIFGTIPSASADNQAATTLATLSAAGVLNIAGAFRIGGVNFADRTGPYSVLVNPDGSGDNALIIGNATDAANYYRNTSHFIQSKDGSTTYLTFGSSGIGAFAVSPTAPTPTASDNSTKLATTQFVQSAGLGFPSGTVIPFYQAAAPTGWTKLVTQNDKALRVVSGAGGVAGGTNSFSSVMAQTVVGSTTISSGTMPSHTHNIYNDSTFAANATTASGGGATRMEVNNIKGTASGSAGSDGAHNHTITMAIQYIDVILASKN